jgi:hypothetical protein
LRAGGDQHGASAFSIEQLTDSELEQIVDWLVRGSAAGGSYVVPENRRTVVLAWEYDGQPLTGADGLIQMVVAMDDYVGRFSHWVSDIEAE